TLAMNQQSVSQSFVILLTVVGPLVEEVMKAAATLWAAEKRPFFFKSSTQILICMAFSGLCFAVIENILYLNFYIPNPANWTIIWRWTVCVALHTGCTLITGVGISKMWRHAMTTRTRPRLPVAAPYMFAAFVVHGVYNFLALFMELGS
ncbi:MAG: PrsW family glutamic-type intramembrane protease, partial [Planctomycetota bacterium]